MGERPVGDDGVALSFLAGGEQRLVFMPSMGDHVGALSPESGHEGDQVVDGRTEVNDSRFRFLDFLLGSGDNHRLMAERLEGVAEPYAP